MQFEPKFDIIDLPSEGIFYTNGCNKVKVYHLTLADEEIMTAPNLLQSGEMLDRLLERKVVRVNDDTPFIHPSKMLIGDRLAILVFLRVTMDNIYKIVVDGALYDFDLTTLKVKEMTAKPNQKLEFDFKLPKSGDMVTFRLMTGEDEKEIRLYQMKTNQTLPFNKVIRLEKLITSVNGETDKMLISAFVKQMNITDANKLLRYMNDVTPSIDLEVEVISPVTNKAKTQFLELTGEFFFPNT
jgi:hypothetical protein